MKNGVMRLAFVLGTLGILAVLAAWVGCAPVPVVRPDTLTRYESTRICMGVRARVVVYARGWPQAERAMNAAFDTINALDASMSDFRADSEVSRIGAAAGVRGVTVSGDLVRLLIRARRLAALTGGAFDPTVAPASHLWRGARRESRLPDAAAIERVRSLVNWRDLRVDEAASSVMLAREGMGIDLGGIAKGYAARRALDTLRSLGHRSAMVAMDGDVAVGDPPPGSRGWTVEIAPGTGMSRMLMLVNACVSTSGDEQQHLNAGGTRHSHIVDPRTGRALTNVAWAVVLADHGEDADALASASCVLGPQAAREILAQVPGVGAIIEADVVGEDGRVERERVVIDPTGRLARAGVAGVVE